MEQDIEEVRAKFLNHEFDETTFVFDAQKMAAYARACGETAPRFTDTDHPDFQAAPTFVSSVTGGRSMPPDFPRLGGMGMDAGKGVEPQKPIRPGVTLTARTHLHDIYTKTGRSGRMIFLVSRMEFFDPDDELVTIADTRQVIRERPTQ